MQRHDCATGWAALAAVFLMTFGLVIVGDSDQALAAEPPNIVLIVGDDQAWTDFGFMGHPQIKTPHLDRLADQSLLFTRGYVTSSLCCPSLAAILTGKYPHQTRVTGNEPQVPPGVKLAERYRNPAFLELVDEANGFMAEHPRIPAELARAGYLSLQTGKWWAGNYSTGGFTHGMSHGDQSQGGRHGDQGLEIGRQTMQPIYDFMGMAREQKKPFFVWYAPMLPHDPHNPPERLLAKYRDLTPSIHVARYWAMCEWFDETCGALLDYLDRENLADNTIIAFVVDNGRVQDPDSKAALPSKNSPHDTGLRTPIMLRWPGHIAPRVCETSVSSIDLAPTLYQAVSVDRPAGLPGINLLDESAVRDRKAIFGACFLHNAVDTHSPAKNLTWRWCIAGDWKLIVPTPENLKASISPGVPPTPLELFQIKDDPAEAHNLADQQSRKVEELQELLDAWWNPTSSEKTSR